MEYAETTINNLLNKDLNKLIDDTTFLNSFGKNENIVISILKLCKYQGYTIAGLWNYFKTVKGLSVSYSKIYRIVKELENKKFLDADGVGLYYTTQGGSSFLLDYLQSKTSTIQNTEKKENNKPHWDGINDKQNWIIKKMRNITSNRMTFYFNNPYEADEDKKKIERYARYDLNFLFVEYVKDIIQKCLILKRTHRQTGKVEFKKMPYTTRFTSINRIKENMKEFDRRFNYFSEKHNKAVFLTLTTDPKKFNNLNEACENIGKAFKKLMDYLNRRHKAENGGKLDYISAFEFSPSGGLPHLHIIIFGVDYLDLSDNRKKNDDSKAKYKSVHKISELWEKYGQGKLVYIYGIRKLKDGSRWTYKDNRKRPKDDKKGDPALYLKKYLMKIFFTLKGWKPRKKQIKLIDGTIKIKEIEGNGGIINQIRFIEFELYKHYKGKPEQLKKIKKEMYNDIYKQLGTLPFYLATNKRFYTSSKVPKKEEQGGGSGDWDIKVLGAFYSNNLPLWVEKLFQMQNHKRKRNYTAVDYGSHTVYNAVGLGGW